MTFDPNRTFDPHELVPPDSIPEGAMPVAVVLMVEVLDEDGDHGMYLHSSQGASARMALGMITVAQRRYEQHCLEDWEEE
jgi:hypothetical protein